ncbi:uncharacterized protein VTP21DRAFT_9882 [Calcarisporiella thermophila]|uniref:uncharacterized protein n=1 Tax=Calcarisporiella thermophila TaxID=911321 RepID=UPI0037421DB7
MYGVLDDLENRQKRLKVGRACQPCRLKKIKCDGLHPCMQCKARGRTCSYGRDSHAVPQPLQYMDAGEKGWRYESLVESLSPRDSSSALKRFNHHLALSPYAQQDPSCSPNPAPPIAVPDNDNMYVGGGWRYPSTRPPVENKYRLTASHELSTNKMVQSFQSIYEKITLGIARFGTVVEAKAESHPPGLTHPPELPPPLVQEKLIEIYFGSHRYEFLPIIHKHLFLQQLRGPASGPISPLLLNILFAHAVKQADPDVCTTPSIAFFRRAQGLLGDFLDESRVSTVQALLLMALYEDGHVPARKRAFQAWTYSGMACRMAYDLNLHCDGEEGEMSRAEREQRRRVFWGCFVVDKLIGVATDKPSIIHPASILVPTPVCDPESDERERQVVQDFYHLLRLVEIRTQVADFVRSTVVSDDPEFENRVSFLEQQLNDWLTRLPEHLRYTVNMFIPPPPGIRPTSPRVAYLHLLFHSTAIALFQPYLYSSNRTQDQRCSVLAGNVVRIGSYLEDFPRLTVFLHGSVILVTVRACISHAINHLSSDQLIAGSSLHMLFSGTKMIQRLSQNHNFIAPEDGESMVKLTDPLIQAINEVFYANGAPPPCPLPTSSAPLSSQTTHASGPSHLQPSGHFSERTDVRLSPSGPQSGSAGGPRDTAEDKERRELHPWKPLPADKRGCSEELMLMMDSTESAEMIRNNFKVEYSAAGGTLSGPVSEAEGREYGMNLYSIDPPPPSSFVGERAFASQPPRKAPSSDSQPAPAPTMSFVRYPTEGFIHNDPMGGYPCEAANSSRINPGAHPIAPDEMGQQLASHPPPSSSADLDTLGPFLVQVNEFNEIEFSEAASAEEGLATPSPHDMTDFHPSPSRHSLHLHPPPPIHPQVSAGAISPGKVQRSSAPYHHPVSSKHFHPYSPRPSSSRETLYRHQKSISLSSLPTLHSPSSSIPSAKSVNGPREPRRALASPHPGELPVALTASVPSTNGSLTPVPLATSLPLPAEISK